MRQFDWKEQQDSGKALLYSLLTLWESKWEYSYYLHLAHPREQPQVPWSLFPILTYRLSEAYYPLDPLPAKKQEPT